VKVTHGQVPPLLLLLACPCSLLKRAVSGLEACRFLLAYGYRAITLVSRSPKRGFAWCVEGVREDLSVNERAARNRGANAGRRGATDARSQELAAYDAIIIGAGSRFGRLPLEMAISLD
jgi:hypothetical protein